MCLCECVWAGCGQRLRPLLSDLAFSSVGASRWSFSLVLASLRWLALSLGSPPPPKKKQNLQTCLVNTSSWDSASKVLQGRGDESVLLLILSGGPDRRTGGGRGRQGEAGVSGFEWTPGSLLTSIHLQCEMQFTGCGGRDDGIRIQVIHRKISTQAFPSRKGRLLHPETS